MLFNGTPGSTHRLEIDGDSYLLDFLTSNSQARSNEFATAEAGSCVRIVVTGYRVEEKGHFPNPMATFKVFKVLDISFGRNLVLGREATWNAQPS